MVFAGSDEGDRRARDSEVFLFRSSQQGHDIQPVIRTSLLLVSEDLEGEQVPALCYREAELWKNLEIIGGSDDLRLDAG